MYDPLCLAQQNIYAQCATPHNRRSYLRCKIPFPNWIYYTKVLRQVRAKITWHFFFTFFERWDDDLFYRLHAYGPKDDWMTEKSILKWIPLITANFKTHWFRRTLSEIEKKHVHINRSKSSFRKKFPYSLKFKINELSRSWHLQIKKIRRLFCFVFIFDR